MPYLKDPHEWYGVFQNFWPRIARELPPLKKKPFLKRLRKGGRPRADDRLAFGAILWRLRSGGIWKRLPVRFGSSRTARRRLKLWSRGLWLEKAWLAYVRQLGLDERKRWRDCLAARAYGPQHSWRFFLDCAFRLEIAPELPRELE